MREPIFKKLLPLLNLVDDVLTRVSLIRLMAWIFTFELKSQKNDQRQRKDDNDDKAIV